jgi:hypothetical protein
MFKLLSSITWHRYVNGKKPNSSKQIYTAPTNVLLHEPKTKNRR